MDDFQIKFVFVQVEYFYRIHDPTTKNRQGNDAGTQYRSAVYYEDDEQKRIAEVCPAAARCVSIEPKATLVFGGVISRMSDSG